MQAQVVEQRKTICCHRVETIWSVSPPKEIESTGDAKMVHFAGPTAISIVEANGAKTGRSKVLTQGWRPMNQVKVDAHDQEHGVARAFVGVLEPHLVRGCEVLGRRNERAQVWLGLLASSGVLGPELSWSEDDATEFCAVRQSRARFRSSLAHLSRYLALRPVCWATFRSVSP